MSICNQPPRSTQSGHPFVGRRNEYQPKGGNILGLGSKGRCNLCIGIARGALGARAPPRAEKQILGLIHRGKL